MFMIKEIKTTKPQEQGFHQKSKVLVVRIDFPNAVDSCYINILIVRKLNTQ